MKELFIITLGLVGGALAGCSSTMQISTCKEYKNNTCVDSKTIEVKECKEPIKYKGKLYCK